MKWIVEVPEGGWIPRGYGRYRRVIDRMTLLVMPIPLNFLWRWGYGLWCAIAYELPRGNWWEEQLSRAFFYGRATAEEGMAKRLERAQSRGYDEGRQSVVKEVDEYLDARAAIRRWD